MPAPAAPERSRRPSSSCSTSSSSSDRPLDLTVDDEWQDAEADEEVISVKSLHDETVFPSVQEALKYSKEDGGVDLVDWIRRFDLDFYGCIRLINYLRVEVRGGNLMPKVEDQGVFEDDKYLQPELEDDALLFSVDEVLEIARRDSKNHNAESVSRNEGASSMRVKELEEQLERLQKQFTDYRDAVAKTLDQRWSDRDGASGSIGVDGPGIVSSSWSVLGSRAPVSASDAQKQGKPRDDDSHYFDSYSYNDIHEIMLKDTIRTSAYRDFIYTHKPLFASKAILDIGCGTGILSMFSAKAGAAKVFAVDNSDIISKARENVAQNGLLDTIQCIRGKVEDVELPGIHTSSSSDASGNGKFVDIIVSEWMGYCLLYESMLDSVIHARDRFLNPTSGLMVPSHCTLHIAPISAPDYIDDSIGFWSDVYGFDMSSMTEKIHDDVVVRSFPMSAIPAASAVFKTLPLHTIKVEELAFEGAEFEVVLEHDVNALDAWSIWFDTFFLPSRTMLLPHDARAEDWPKDDDDMGNAFTTGPGGMETHWRAGLLTIDHAKKGKRTGRLAVGLKERQVIRGKVAYRKVEDNSRQVDIEVEWEAVGTEEKGRQVWALR